MSENLLKRLLSIRAYIILLEIILQHCFKKKKDQVAIQDHALIYFSVLVLLWKSWTMKTNWVQRFDKISFGFMLFVQSIVWSTL